MDDGRLYGTQSVARAMSLVREVATRGQFGWRLVDLAERCGLDKGTAHRLLAHLKRERMVRQRSSDRHYVPGPLMFELSLALPEYGGFLRAGNASLHRLVERLSGVGFLYLRSGYDFVCALRIGAPRINLSIDAGTRRPLMTSAGGIAMIMAMADDEARDVLAHNRSVVSRFGGVPVASLERMLKRSQTHRLAMHEHDLIPGWNSYAVAVRDVAQAPFASLMVAGEADALSRVRDPQIAKLLSGEAAALGREAERTLPSVG